MKLNALIFSTLIYGILTIPIKPTQETGFEIHLERRQFEMLASALAPIAMNVASGVAKQVVSQGMQSMAQGGGEKADGGKSAGGEKADGGNPLAGIMGGGGESGGGNPLASLMGGGGGESGGGNPLASLMGGGGGESGGNPLASLMGGGGGGNPLASLMGGGGGNMLSGLLGGMMK